MANVNKVILIGRLTRDPELRYTPKQTPVTELGLAINRPVGGGEDGERREETTFVDVTVWDRQAENCCQYLSKGRTVYVEGSLRLDTWDDKTSGEKRSKLRVVAQLVQFLDGGRRDDPGRPQDLDSPRSSEPQRPAPARAASPAPAAAPSSTAAAPDHDEDIPF
jgi:single-strand DNA-binding protein